MMMGKYLFEKFISSEFERGSLLCYSRPLIRVNDRTIIHHTEMIWDLKECTHVRSDAVPLYPQLQKLVDIDSFTYISF